MNTTSLPTEELDPSDSDRSSCDSSVLVHYVIRVTSHDKFSFDVFYQAMKAEPELYQFVIGRETVPQEHFHMVASADSAATEQSIRDIIRSFLTPFWAVENEFGVPDKLPRGFGNKQYNLQVCKDLDSAVSYAVKCSEYVFEGFTEEYILSRAAESFQKKKVSNFKSELLTLNEEFHNSNMDIIEYVEGFICLKAKYSQGVRLSDAYAQALSASIRRDPTLARHYAEEFVLRQ